jgi:hypothetical protein
VVAVAQREGIRERVVEGDVRARVVAHRERADRMAVGAQML